MTTLTCHWCGITGSASDFDIHPSPSGFWCPECEGFTYMDEAERVKHRFLLLLEDKGDADVQRLSPAIPKLKKRLSPLRYPGGKSKLIDYLYSRLSREQLDTFIEVFAGGASLGLALLDAGSIKSLVLNDKDPGVYALWKTILECPQELTDRLQSIVPTHRDLSDAKNLLALNEASTPELAWAFLLANRLSFSGIVKGNPLGGKNGSQDALTTRWNPEALAERITHIHSMRDRIELRNMDACEFLETEGYWYSKATIFVDPPYWVKGKALYTHYYEEKDHMELAELLQNMYMSFPEPDIIVTYDNHPRIREMYPLAKQEAIQRRYSI
jgi:DNA adenine methylase